MILSLLPRFTLPWNVETPATFRFSEAVKDVAVRTPTTLVLPTRLIPAPTASLMILLVPSWKICKSLLVPILILSLSPKEAEVWNTTFSWNVDTPVALNPPVIEIFPVPVISLLLRSKLPPSCGVVSDTTSPPPVTVTFAIPPLSAAVTLEPIKLMVAAVPTLLPSS